ncbi:MAG: hypothetical protein QW303_01380 [Nitrososphaerota archaeon]
MVLLLRGEQLIPFTQQGDLIPCPSVKRTMIDESLIRSVENDLKTGISPVLISEKYKISEYIVKLVRKSYFETVIYSNPIFDLLRPKAKYSVQYRKFLLWLRDSKFNILSPTFFNEINKFCHPPTLIPTTKKISTVIPKIKFFVLLLHLDIKVSQVEAIENDDGAGGVAFDAIWNRYIFVDADKSVKKFVIKTIRKKARN